MEEVYKIQIEVCSKLKRVIFLVLTLMLHLLQWVPVEIIIWSDIKDQKSKTYVSGKIYSRGGSFAGNGGTIETSGYDLEIGSIDRINCITEWKNQGSGY